MGNDHPKAQSERQITVNRQHLPDPPNITRRKTTDINHFDTLQYEYFNTNKAKIDSIRNRWQAIQELPTISVCKPLKIETSSSKILFLETFQLRVTFEAYDVSLARHVASLQKTMPLVPEIILLNVLSDCNDGLQILFDEAIRHENVSPESIFQIGRDNWALNMPSLGRETLVTRIASGNTKLMFLLAPEIKPEIIYDSFLSDVYSLGITIIHSASPFSSAETQRQLCQSDIDAKLRFLDTYYSKKFVKLLRKMTTENPLSRKNCHGVATSLSKLRDM